MKTKNIKTKSFKSLTRIRKLFPQVKHIKDAKSGILVSVDDSDNKKGRKKIASQCALAQACVRQKIADGAIINIGTSYLIRGNTAIRYKTSTGISREITSFDRHQHFEPGKDYLLSPISPSNTLERQREYSQTKKNKSKKWNEKYDKNRWNKACHHTLNVRKYSKEENL